MQTVIIIRNKIQQSLNTQTLGALWFENKQLCITLELPWNNNIKKISCIPTGTYNVVRRVSKKYGEHFHIQNVPNRSLILIHHANYHFDLLGCIGVGKNFAIINKDAHLDITSSRDTINMLLK
jgi:hypothetical protein